MDIPETRTAIDEKRMFIRFIVSVCKMNEVLWCAYHLYFLAIRLFFNRISRNLSVDTEKYPMPSC